jgi:hypothetical protein
VHFDEGSITQTYRDKGSHVGNNRMTTAANNAKVSCDQAQPRRKSAEPVWASLYGVPVKIPKVFAIFKPRTIKSWVAFGTISAAHIDFPSDAYKATNTPHTPPAAFAALARDGIRRVPVSCGVRPLRENHARITPLSPRVLSSARML